MVRRPLLVLFCFLLAAGCGGGAATEADTDSPPQVVDAAPVPDDVLSKVYNSDYRVPAGFYVDERATTPRSYTLYHVKDTSISYELCTDDPDEAAAWEAADNQDRLVHGQFVGSHESDWYFEFIRELSYTDDVGNVAGLSSPGYARVFKCASISRDGVDRNLRDGFGGVINQRPLTAGSVREFTEYLWQFTYFEAATAKVMDSFSTDRPQAHEHTLRLALVYNQGFDRCDRIELVDWVFSADKASGELMREFRFRQAIEARLIDGVPERC